MQKYVMSKKATGQIGPTQNYKIQDYSLDDLYRSASSGGIGAYRPDVSGAINAYTQQANADKSYAENAYNTTRNDLLTSLKRFQENNAKQQANQRQSYLTDQSSLDIAKQQANRQSRIGTAARGLGGSGLQKLAEIQNDLGMQGDESQLANENQSVMDALRTALSQETEDTNTKVNRARTNYENQIRNIDANLAAQIAAVNYQADQAYAQSLANARASVASGQAAARNAYNVLTGNTNALADALSKQNEKQLMRTYGATNAKNLANTIANYYSNLFANTSGINNNAYNTAMNNVNGLLRMYGLM
jgi:hypothetical protein